MCTHTCVLCITTVLAFLSSSFFSSIHTAVRFPGFPPHPRSVCFAEALKGAGAKVDLKIRQGKTHTDPIIQVTNAGFSFAFFRVFLRFRGCCVSFHTAFAATMKVLLPVLRYRPLKHIEPEKKKQEVSIGEKESDCGQKNPLLLKKMET